MLIDKLRSLVNYLIKFLELQLYLTLFVWPILLAWGLPLSILSPLGNFIFTPFLFVFLLLSTIIFFFEILYIPNQWVIYILDYLCVIWIKIIRFFDDSYLITAQKPNIIILFILPVIAVLIIKYKKNNNHFKKFLSLSVIICLTFMYLQFKPNFIPMYQEIQSNKKHLNLFYVGGQYFIIDVDSFCQLSSISWIKYYFVPYLNKNGIRLINYLIVLQPSQTVFQALNEVCQKVKVKNIYIPNFKGKLTNKAWFAWQELVQTCQLQKTEIINIEEKEIKIEIDNTKSIQIKPKQEFNSKNKFSYPKISCLAVFDDHYFRFENYSLKSLNFKVKV